MTTPNDHTPDPAAPGTAQGAPGTGGQQAEVDWELDINPYKKRFGGLQAKYQTELKKWEADATKLFDASEALKALTGEKEALAAQFQSLKTTSEAAVAELAQIKAKNDRLSLLMSDFPDLLGLEADGLLPGGSGDELRGKLTAMREKLANMGKQQAAAALSGQTPPASPKPADATPDALLKQAIAAMNKGDMVEYDRLYAQYLAEITKK